VAVALGPNPAFPTGRVGSFIRRVPDHRVVTAAPPRGKPRPAKEPRPPRVAELLRKAQTWRALLDSGQVANQAEIARREGVSRARVTQIMCLLRLAPEVQHRVLEMPAVLGRKGISEHSLRPIARIKDSAAQLASFGVVVGAD